MSGNQIIVQIDGNEAGVLKALAKSEAAAKKLESSLNKAGADGADAGKMIADAMIKAAKGAQRPIDSMLKQLRGGTDASRDLARALEKEVKGAALDAAGGVDTITAQIVKMRPELAGVVDQFKADFAEADKIAKFESTRQQLAELGEQFQPLAREIEAATALPIKEAQGAASRLLDELRQIDPSKAQAIQRAVEASAKAAERNTFDALVAKLGNASTEARQLANLIGDRMREATLEAEGGVDGVIRKIEAIDPAMKSVTQQWRKNWNTAADKAQESLGPVLGRIRELGEEGDKAAGKIVNEFQTAGKLSASAIDKIFAPLDTSDKRVAEAMNSLKARVKESSEESESMFQKIGKSAVAQLGAAAGAYVGVTEAVQGTTAAIQGQLKVLEDARQANMTVAEAQASARKNLNVREINSDQRRFLLDDFVQQVSADFSIDDLASITKAVGDAVSSGANFKGAQSAIRTSAAINVLSPTETDETASAIVKAMRSTGIENSEVAADKLLAVGSMSQVIDPAKLFRNLPPALQAGRQTAAEGMGTQGALESAAIFAALSKAAGDDQGESTRTATIQLGNKVREFFTKNASESIRSADPGTPLARINYIRRNDLFSDFKSTSGEFGEETFKPGIENLFQGGDTMKIAMETNRMVQASGESTKLFRETVNDFRDITSQLSVSVANAGVSAADNRQDASDSLAAMKATIRQTVGDALADTRQGFGISDYIGEIGLNYGVGLKGAAGPEEAVSGVMRLLRRRDEIAADGIDASELPKVKRLESNIGSLVNEVLDSSIMRKSERLKAARDSAVANVVAGREYDGTPGTTFGLTQRFGIGAPQIAAAANSPELMNRIVDILDRQLKLQEEQLKEQRLASEAAVTTADASTETAENTASINARPNPASAQAAANGAR